MNEKSDLFFVSYSGIYCLKSGNRLYEIIGILYNPSSEYRYCEWISGKYLTINRL